MSELVVKRYVSTRLLPDASTWNVSGAAHTYVHISDYAALHAEAEALRVALLEIASANPAHRGIEWAKSYASDGLKGSGSELYARWLDTFKEAEALRDQNRDLRIEADGWFSRVNGVEAKLEALRAENEKWQRSHRDIYEPALHDAHSYIQELRAELEAARGLLRESRKAYTEAIHWDDQQPVMKKIDTFITATPAPEAQGHIAEASKMVEHGERQEAVAWIVPDFGFLFPTEDAAQRYLRNINDLRKPTALYATPQPGPDVRALAASLYQACGAYDMPERILDALSAAANGEPFTHMIDGLLPCVPPSEQDVRSLVEALEECAASLAWNCFGECRAVHAGPIMPAAMALEAARTALAALPPASHDKEGT